MFDFSLFSKYRSELMGIATLMIIICHMPAHGVVMPALMASVISYGGLGCDIFLFLSGMGLWFSLNKNTEKGLSILGWLIKRYVRVLVPYLLIVIPVFAVKAMLGGWTFGTYLWRVSSLSFWTEGWGAWFVSLILVLYLVAPWLYKLLSGNRKWMWTVVLVTIAWGLGSIASLSGILENVRFCVCRIPSFIIGMALASDVKLGTRVSFLKLLLCGGLVVVFSLVLKFLGISVSLFWVEGMLLLIAITWYIDLIENRSIIRKTLAFMGGISLESYLTNVFVLSFFLYIPWRIGKINVNPGNWTYYVVGTVFCILISIIVHQISGSIIKRLK